MVEMGFLLKTASGCTVAACSWPHVWCRTCQREVCTREARAYHRPARHTMVAIKGDARRGWEIRWAREGGRAS